MRIGSAAAVLALAAGVSLGTLLATKTFGFSSPALAAETKKAPRAKVPPIAANHPILGRWHLDLLGGECNEDVEFRADGTRLVTAGPQKLRATFTISAKPDAQGFYKITDKIEWSNGDPDCAGRKPPVGDTASGYVIFNTRNDLLHECTAKDMTKCWGPYVKNPGISADLLLDGAKGP